MHEAQLAAPPIFQYAWLIFALPFAGMLINIFGGKDRSERSIGWTAVLFSAAAFALSLAVVITLAGLLPEETKIGQGFDVPLFTFLSIGSTTLQMGVKIDTLTGVMLMVVTFVGTLIHIYAIGYMHGDSRFQRFFVYMNLFMAMMLILVLADNYLMMFIGWEGVGLCSFLLIGFWFEKDANANAANKAMFANRIGDYGVMLAMFAMFVGFGTLQFGTPEAGGVFAAMKQAFTQNAAIAGLLPIIGLLLLIGVTGKSAQIPLYVWLPDAMAGPTPVSALIHAATMVTAGVYLIARSFPLFDLTPDVRAFIGILGAATALFAGSIALAQFDIKKVLAYSTVSQLGFMVAAVGMGATVAGIFHLLTHAFFKALLFLGAGSVIHGVEHGHHVAHKAHDVHGDNSGHRDDHPAEEEFDPQDMRNMGGLWDRMPITKWVYVIGALALAGVVPFAGFWSKDEILRNARDLNPVAFVLLLIAAGFTAFYMTRQVIMIFFGKPRTEAATHAEESPKVMTYPLIVLAFFSAVIGLINLPSLQWFTKWLAGEAEAGGLDPVVAIGSTVLALGVIALGLFIYNPNRQKAGVDDPLRKLGRLFTWLNKKWGIDELYGLLFVRPFIRLSDTLAWTIDGRFWHDWFHDRVLRDGFLKIADIIANPIDKIVIDGGFNGLGRLVAWASGGLRKWQSGFVRQYALVMLGGVVLVIAWFALMVLQGR